VRVETPVGATDYTYKFHNQVTAANLNPLIGEMDHLRQQLGVRLLLVTTYLHRQLIDRLVASGCEFIDGAGNVYLDSPTAYVLISGRKPPEIPKPKSPITAASLKLVHSILSDPQVLSGDCRHLSQLAGISLGSVSTILRNLARIGYLQTQQRGEYRILEPEQLLWMWKLGYGQQLRHQLWLGRFSLSGGAAGDATERVAAIKRGAEQGRYLIGGELAAAILLEQDETLPVTLHIRDDYRAVLSSLQLQPDPEGKITVLKQFGTANGGTQSDYLATILLIVGELWLERDVRVREMAALLEARYLS
jgi:hypothetical protein